MDISSIVGKISGKLNSDTVKNAMSKMGNTFNEVMASGNIQEGTIFEAASKLGVNNTNDLKGLFEQVKQNPMQTILGAMDTLHESGFRAGQANVKNAAERAKQQTPAAATQTTQNAAPAQNTPAIETTEATEEEAPAANDGSGLLKDLAGTLKTMGIDVSNSEIQAKIKDCNGDVAKLKEFFIKQFGGQGGGTSSMEMEA